MSSIHNFVSVDYLFRGKENRINCYVDPITTLKLEIEEKHTNLEWSATFPIEYIEELTKKTGNFKSFDVFVAMLQTVLTQNSESLSLDLMSYSDLEELRKLKMGSIGLGKSPNVINNDINRQNKRYLILTYTTDFDKIHYPLPLTFQGVPDVKNLKETILSLRRQVYSTSKVGTDYEKFEIVELNKKLLQLKSENDQLQSTIQKYKNHFQNSELSEDLKKELKAVKSVVRSLEDELAEEKSKHQRILMRKHRENKTLIDELSELKASKRNLNFRVHNLTNELAMYKRQRSKNGFTSPRPPVCPSPKSSFDLLIASSKMLPKSTKNSRSRSPQMFSDPETSRIADKFRNKGSYSFMSRTAVNPRRCLSADRYQNSGSKFDPTAYVEQQKIKKKEIQERRKRELRIRLNSNNYSDHSRDSSPISYRNIRANSNRSNLISSSNASSMSNLDERCLTNKSKNSSSSNKYNVEHLTDKKSHPTALNHDSDYEASDNDSAYKFNIGSTNKKSSNGLRSPDSSIIKENLKSSKHKTFRRRLLDSEEEDTEILSNRIGKSSIKNENCKSRKSRIQQSNVNGNNLLNHRNSSHHHNDPSEDINDIDRRLNALQSFFQKYLHDE